MANQPTGLLAVNSDLLFIKRDLALLIEKNLDMNSDEYKAAWEILWQRIGKVQERLQKFIELFEPIAKSDQLEAYPIGRVQYAQAKLKEMRDNIIPIDFGRSRQPATLVQAAEAIKDADDRWKEAVAYFAENMNKLTPDVRTIVKSVIQAIEGEKETRSAA